MSSTGSRVLRSETYQLEGDPYLLKQVSAAYLADLARRRKEAEQKEEDDAQARQQAAQQDPLVLKLRDELEALKLKAEKELGDARGEAGKILEAAQDEARQVREKASQDGYADGLKRGTEEGYEQGLAKGEAEGLAKWNEGASRWESLLEKTLDEKVAYLADREQAMIELVGEVAAKILPGEIKANPEVVGEQMRRAIQRATDRSKLVVHLNPGDLDSAKRTGEGLRLSDGVKQIEYLADEHIMAGGVLIETPNGIIDAKIDTQLHEVIKGLLEEAYDGQ